MGVTMDQGPLRIGEVASAAGVNIQTLRYYERRGILAAPERSAAGHREYPADAVRRVRFIKRAQDLGFSLLEIAELLRLRDDQSASCRDVRSAARAKMMDVDRKLGSLRAMRRALGVLERSCVSDGAARRCPILEALDDAPTRRPRG